MRSVPSRRDTASGYTMFDMDRLDAYYFTNAHTYTSHMLAAIPTSKEIAAMQTRLAAARLQPAPACQATESLPEALARVNLARERASQAPMVVHEFWLLSEPAQLVSKYVAAFPKCGREGVFARMFAELATRLRWDSESAMKNPLTPGATALLNSIVTMCTDAAERGRCMDDADYVQDVMALFNFLCHQLCHPESGPPDMTLEQLPVFMGPETVDYNMLTASADAARNRAAAAAYDPMTGPDKTRNRKGWQKIQLLFGHLAQAIAKLVPGAEAAPTVGWGMGPTTTDGLAAIASAVRNSGDSDEDADEDGDKSVKKRSSLMCSTLVETDAGAIEKFKAKAGVTT